ncbi:MAG: hypothetical protein KGI97_05870, partial [Alphaproteobacteria bacterium]|nr:hypothetical protein [Alphaproteobacteria bacterium]
MTKAARWMKGFRILLLVAVMTGFAAQAARADDLPLAAASPLSGVAFDDKPLILPVQRNFQMAMLTASSELGRSCGKMEAYGWRMGQTEQARVNQVFNNTVDRLRLLGYDITPETLSSVSSDITVFTADRKDRHFIFLWSAGQLGLVMTLCETSPPLMPAGQVSTLVPSVQVFPFPSDIISQPLAILGERESTPKPAADGFTPVGKWEGRYTCLQGYTGGTLTIDRLHGENFDGTFSFYPTSRNRSVPPGSYHVSGQYDPVSKRILINPGKWIKRPPNFYNTVMVGSFYPSTDSLSAVFEGVTGCTSFEARRFGAHPVAAHHERRRVRHAAKKQSRHYRHHTKKTRHKHEAAKKKAVKETTAKPANAQDIEAVEREEIKKAIAAEQAKKAAAPVQQKKAEAKKPTPSAQPAQPSNPAKPATPEKKAGEPAPISAAKSVMPLPESKVTVLAPDAKKAAEIKQEIKQSEKAAAQAKPSIPALPSAAVPPAPVLPEAEAAPTKEPSVPAEDKNGAPPA